MINIKSTYTFLPSLKPVSLYPSLLLRSLWIQNPMVSNRSAFAVSKNSTDAFDCHQLRFAKKESGKSRFCFSQNSQLARIANSTIAQGGVRSKDSFYLCCSVSVFFLETWASQATRILRTTINPPSRTLSTATRSGSRSPLRSKSSYLEASQKPLLDLQNLQYFPAERDYSKLT